MRSGTIGNPAIAVAAVLSLFPLAACSAFRTALGADCIRAWNDDVPEDVRSDFDVAVVFRWTNEADEEGCGVLFRTVPGRPWMIFGGVVDHGVVAHWSRVGGEHWGRDGPEGPSTDDDANVHVGSAGRLFSGA